MILVALFQRLTQYDPDMAKTTRLENEGSWSFQDMVPKLELGNQQ